ncbi:MAG: ATP-binding cassette domain-containing protein [Bacillus subtilis]|nr:ATP-binding cassette domain-containing protein [Bacillus subtilis]
MGIRFEHVSYHYSGNAKRPYEAIKDITLEIQSKNEFIALVGHTGSGKSTLAQHMNALVFPSEGKVELFGNIITSKRNKAIRYNDLRRKVGLVFQFPEYQLFEETVEKDIMFGPLNFKVPLEEARELAKRGDRARRSRRELSAPQSVQFVGRGEKARVDRRNFGVGSGNFGSRRADIGTRSGRQNPDDGIVQVDPTTNGENDYRHLSRHGFGLPLRIARSRA